MRVLQVMADAGTGGAEVFFERLVPALARAGLIQCAVIRRDEERAAHLAEAGIAVRQLPFRRHLDLTSRRQLAREVAGFDPDIVLSWLSRAASLCPADVALHVARLGGYDDLRPYRGCDHLIGNAPAIVDHLVDRGWPADRVHYLPNFVAAEEHPPQARAQLDTPERAPLLLALGRLHARKGFDVLLQALTRLPDVYLWLAGDGPERRVLRRLATRLGVVARVRFLGWRNDVSALFRACDVVVCPSRYDPFGSVVVEAWAHHRPLVATRSEGPEALVVHGRTGLLVPKDEPAQLASTVSELLKDDGLRERLAAAGRAAYEADYTERAVVERYLELFERLTSGPSTAAHRS